MLPLYYVFFFWNENVIKRLARHIFSEINYPLYYVFFSETTPYIMYFRFYMFKSYIKQVCLRRQAAASHTLTIYLFICLEYLTLAFLIVNETCNLILRFIKVRVSVKAKCWCWPCGPVLCVIFVEILTSQVFPFLYHKALICLLFVKLKIDISNFLKLVKYLPKLALNILRK